MSRIIDFHSHILPNVDDGSASLEESIAMLRLAAEQGVKHMVATPHFYPQHDSPERFLRRRQEAADKLQEELLQYPQLPTVSMGVEAYYFRGISDSSVLSELTFFDKKCILIEMPQAPWTDYMYRELEAIYIKRNVTPIIAHIDRYIKPFQTFGIPKRLAELPVLVQANAEFFLDKWTSCMAMNMLRTGKIHVLGSDCHNLRDRSPNLGKAVKCIQKRLGDASINCILEIQNDLLNNTIE